MNEFEFRIEANDIVDTESELSGDELLAVSGGLPRQWTDCGPNGLKVDDWKI